MTPTRKQIHNAANYFLNSFGVELRKHDIRFEIWINERTRQQNQATQEQIVDRIWRRVKKLTPTKGE